MNDDASSARELFNRSLEKSAKLKFRHGIFEAKRALRRLERAQPNSDDSIQTLNDQKST